MLAEEYHADPAGAADLDDKTIWPGRKSWAIRHAEGGRVVENATWGFPTRKPRVRAPKEGQSPYVVTWWTNARNLEKSMWAPWLAQPEHRCLIPFSLFAEPKKASDRADPKDLDWWFRVLDQETPCFAGVWKIDPEFDRVFSFVTTKPNSLVGPKHEKAMPAILPRADHDAWLTAPWDDAERLIISYPDGNMALDNR